jgi:phage host-nuclease inhibitor protein Gam
MTKRISNKITDDLSQLQFEDALADYAAASEQEQKVLTILDTEMKRIREKYCDELHYLQTRKQQSLDMVQSYCCEQKETLFGKRRSLGTRHGKVGFRLGTPKLKTLRGITWDAVLEKLTETFPAYVRTTQEPAKDLLLAHRNSENVAPLFSQLGLQVIQEETFYIELKKAA